MRRIILSLGILLSANGLQAGDLVIDRANYIQDLRALWRAESIANGTGLRT